MEGVLSSSYSEIFYYIITKMFNFHIKKIKKNLIY